MIPWLWISLLLGELAVGVLALRVAKVDRTHRWIALLAAGALVDELAVEALHRWAFPGAAHPFRGVVRALYEVETAFVVGWPCAVAWTGLRAFQGQARGRRWSEARAVVVGVWLGVVVGHAAFFDPGAMAPARFLLVSGRLFLAVELLAVAAVVVALFSAWRQDWSDAAGVALFLAGVELVIALAGPYATNPFKDWNTVARTIYLAAFAALSGWYVWRLDEPDIRSGPGNRQGFPIDGKTLDSSFPE